MFARLVWKLVRGSRGRLGVALVAVAAYTALFWAVAIQAYDPGRGLAVRRPVAE